MKNSVPKTKPRLRTLNINTMQRRVRASKTVSKRLAEEKTKANSKIKFMPLEINESKNTEDKNKFNGYKANYFI